MFAWLTAVFYGPPDGKPGADDKLSKPLVDKMQEIFGKHVGYRTTHAKGLLVEGKFTPTEQAKTLSVAQHFISASTPVIARFSVGGGIPEIKDADDIATPKGVAIRFLIDDKTNSDLIAHSFNGFAVRTGEDFMEFLSLSLARKNAKGHAEKEKADAEFRKFLANHKSAAAFVLGPKPNPENYGTITYYEPNTHVLTNAQGKKTNVRYRLVPVDGDHLYTDPEKIKHLPENYLEDDLRKRFPEKPLNLIVQVHIANADDILDDATVPYKSSTFVEIGKVTIDKVSDDNAAKQKEIAFSPIPSAGGVKGIASSSDPLIQARDGVYWISADQRRHDK